jgi:hypothetical protein
MGCECSANPCDCRDRAVRWSCSDLQDKFEPSRSAHGRGFGPRVAQGRMSLIQVASSRGMEVQGASWVCTGKTRLRLPQNKRRNSANFGAGVNAQAMQVVHSNAGAATRCAISTVSLLAGRGRGRPLVGVVAVERCLRPRAIRRRRSDACPRGRRAKCSG